MLTETILEDPIWDGFDLAGVSERSAHAVLAHFGIAVAGYELAVLGCTDARIATLNADFRGKPQPTNVLSWPEEDLSAETDGGTPLPLPDADPEDPHHIGDIALAYETCEREAAEQGKPMVDHVTHLVVHGLLHLLGYDHIRDADATLMEGIEVAILGKLGLPDPYN